MRRLLLLIASVACLLPATAQSGRSHDFELARQMEIFNALYRNLDIMYVDSLSPAETIGTAIRGMLRSLDPYTDYYTEQQTKDLKMMLTGKYAGIGALIRYVPKDNRTIIDEPYAGMPAATVGLRKGDIIVAIDDSTMLGHNTQYVSSRLRGEAGTTFALHVLRPHAGGKKPEKMTFKITRQSIKLPEVPYYGMRGDDIGYISFNSFTENSAKTVRRAFLDLKSQGMKSLILDLRDNGGGSLSEAIDIINMWVPQGETLVKTKGKLQQANRDYITRMEPLDTIMPIVVLVNSQTASASEILSGSLQDLDRGVILGERTYGKGLVQVPMDLPYNTNVKLTTSKYYIPSGRCIQAIKYGHSGGGYTERVADSLTHVFYTRAGREVRDGGGIKPDIEVAADTLPNIAVYLDHIDSTEVMYDYIVDYIDTHAKIAPAADFHLTDGEFADFRERAVKAGFNYDPISLRRLKDLEEVAKFEGYYDDAKPLIDSLRVALRHDIRRDIDRNRKAISQMIEDDIISAYWYQAGVVEAGLGTDKQVIAAEELLRDKERYAKTLTAEKKK